MKRDLLILLIRAFLLASLLVTLFSCQNIAETSTPTFTLTPLIETPGTLTYLATGTPTFLATSTPTALSTDITNTLGTLPVPTLVGSERQKFITNLIQNPGNCKLPCWWGLTPGITSWQQTMNFLSYIGHGNLTPDRYHTIDGLGFDFDKPRIVQNLTIDKSSDNTILDIFFTVYGIYDPEGFRTIWSPYSPYQILASYGKPSRVLLSSAAEEENGPIKTTHQGYQLWLFYDQEGFLIRYSSNGDLQNNLIHICPSFLAKNDSWTVYFYLRSSTSSTLLENLVEEYKGFHLLSIETATGLSIDQLMGLAKNEGCFDTPSSLWP